MIISSFVVCMSLLRVDWFNATDADTNTIMGVFENKRLPFQMLLNDFYD